MRTHQTIVLLLASALSILLPSCETERVNERPIGHPVGPYANDPNGFGSNLQNEVRENPLDPGMGQNSGFNPDPGGMGGGTIGRLVGGENNLTQPRPVDTKPFVPSPGPVTDPAGPTIAQPKPVQPAGETIPVAWPTEDPTVVISPYDRTKKIKILNRSTNKPYASGTVLRDTNFPQEVKKFRVP